MNDKNFLNIFRFVNFVFYENYIRCFLSVLLYVNCIELFLIGYDIFWFIFFIVRNSFKILE